MPRNLISNCCLTVENELYPSEFGRCPRCKDGCVFELEERRYEQTAYDGPNKRHQDALRDHLAANASLIEKAKENAREAAGGAVVGLVLTIILAAALLFDGPTW
jgi:hypothetical protein